jgi:hypothetical protein
MSTPRDHHFIPVFYLKQWVGSSGKLIEYSINTASSFPNPSVRAEQGSRPIFIHFRNCPRGSLNLSKQIL